MKLSHRPADIPRKHVYAPCWSVGFVALLEGMWKIPRLLRESIVNEDYGVLILHANGIGKSIKRAEQPGEGCIELCDPNGWFDQKVLAVCFHPIDYERVFNFATIQRSRPRDDGRFASHRLNRNPCGSFSDLLINAKPQPLSLLTQAVRLDESRVGEKIVIKVEHEPAVSDASTQWDAIVKR